MTNRPNDFLQERFILPFDHPAPGLDGALSAVAASGLLTFDTKANTTAGDYIILRVGTDGRIKDWTPPSLVGEDWEPNGSRVTGGPGAAQRADTGPTVEPGCCGAPAP